MNENDYQDLLNLVTRLEDAIDSAAHHVYVANLINWYHAVPQPNPAGNTLRDRIEKELDL